MSNNPQNNQLRPINQPNRTPDTRLPPIGQVINEDSVLRRLQGEGQLLSHAPGQGAPPGTTQWAQAPNPAQVQHGHPGAYVHRPTRTIATTATRAEYVLPRSSLAAPDPYHPRTVPGYTQQQANAGSSRSRAGSHMAPPAQPVAGPSCQHGPMDPDVLPPQSAPARHTGSHEGGGTRFTCRTCGDGFDRRGDLVLHSEIHKSFVCDIDNCRRTFSNDAFLAHHKYEDHRPPLYTYTPLRR
ncbi:hypothetical protein PsYK624_158230 [Phanerochaete sordida]|uniref:C2H2-type domain-containing protein n=1 Tax=Phanerochaete sordida TaxID=48140 RepID=A0A9P3GRL4_9APHY|nr:hypothetical protein PsYK624_158230 [Phanerochaete sordida]